MRTSGKLLTALVLLLGIGCEMHPVSRSTAEKERLEWRSSLAPEQINPDPPAYFPQRGAH